eukprot:g1460.t1
MKLTWYGHSAFKLDLDDASILFDPFLTGNPSFPEELSVEQVAEGVTHVVLTHGHDDHIGDAVEILKETGALLTSNFEICMWATRQGVENINPMNAGGMVDTGPFKVALTAAVHSSSKQSDGEAIYLGNPHGVIIEVPGQKVLYHMGDTDIFSDMALINEIYRPMTGIVPIGDRFTMGGKAAALACRKFFNFDTIVPCHYGSFPIIDQTADSFVAALGEDAGKVQQLAPGGGSAQAADKSITPDGKPAPSQPNAKPGSKAAEQAEAAAKTAYDKTREVFSSDTTIAGEKLTFPQKNPSIRAIEITMEPGEATSWHQHHAPLFAYILEGEITVTYETIGKKVYRQGEGVLEAMDVTHRGENTGDGPVKILAIFLLGDGEQAVVEEDAPDPLPSWKPGATKTAILDFVGSVTTPGSPDYVDPAERIATFDNDGNLWAEQPVYFQLLYAIDKVKEMAKADPGLAAKSPAVKAVVDGDLEALLADHHKGLLDVVALSHAGMTTDEFKSSVGDWLETARHPMTGHRFDEMIYQPMLELLAFLREKDFKTYIVSGGGIDFIRVFAEEAYGIPPEQVIGSSIKSEFQLKDGEAVTVKTPDVFFIDDKEGKPVAINHHIGRVPIFASGNSDGDHQMFQYTTYGNGPGFALLLHHTDAEREWAYDKDSSIGRLDAALLEATDRGWTSVRWVSTGAVLAVWLAQPVPMAGATGDFVRLDGGTFPMGSEGHYKEERYRHDVTVGPFLIKATEVTNAEFATFVDATGYVTTAEKDLDPAQYPGFSGDLLKAGSMVFAQPREQVSLNDFRQWWRYVPGADWRHPEGPGSSIEGMEDHPVVQISPEDAVAYATWAGGRLPTEAEWEFAARGGLKNANYTWGEVDHDPEQGWKANTWQGVFPAVDTGEDGHRGTAPVGSFKPNGYGLYDMAGNVWEHVSDCGRNAA